MQLSELIRTKCKRPFNITMNSAVEASGEFKRKFQESRKLQEDGSTRRFMTYVNNKKMEVKR